MQKLVYQSLDNGISRRLFFGRLAAAGSTWYQKFSLADTRTRKV
jgi:hypothetical protein